MESTIKKISLLLIGATIAVSFFAPGSSAADEFVRIAILKSAPETVMETRGRFRIIDLSTQEILLDERVMAPSKVRVHATGIQVGKTIYPARRLRVISDKTVKILMGENYKRYRGFIDLIADKEGKLLIVNRLDLEQYIRGVMAHEIKDRWPMEAMKAQAVAARTYAVYQIRQSKKADFDLTSDIYSQVYGGRNAERYRTNIAVSRTEGQVLLYNNAILPAYFHSNSGGHTEDVSQLWNHDLLPLKGKPDPYSEGAPNDHWKKNFRSKDVADKLLANGLDVGTIEAINVLERNKSGRVKMLEFVSRDGKRMLLEGKKFRELIGPNELKSNLYDITMKGYFFDVNGKGWGHGVGMSQWGAYNMSRQRKDYREILEFYYPGAKLGKL